MKRSEMVKQINRELRAQSSGNTDIDGCQLLSFIEAAGMLPPLVEVFYMKQDFPKPATPNLHRDIRYTWEEEDVI